MWFSFSQNFKQLIYLTLSEPQRVNCIICTRKIKYKAEITKVELTWYFSCSPLDHSPWKLNSKGSLHAEASHVNCQSASWLLGSPDQASPLFSISSSPCSTCPAILRHTSTCGCWGISVCKHWSRTRNNSDDALCWHPSNKFPKASSSPVSLTIKRSIWIDPKVSTTFHWALLFAICSRESKVEVSGFL